MARSFLIALFIGASAAVLATQQPPTPSQPTNTPPDRPTGGGLLGRPSPPQPVQKQGIEYFVGTWTFAWTGRESAITPGPRTGSVTFARVGDSQVLEFNTEGQSEGSGPYKESGKMLWDPANKSMTLTEHLWGDTELQSTGDWSSPISIRFESSPVRIKTQTLRLRRTYGIVSATSFTIAEEISLDGGPFQRLGGGVFMKRKP